MGYSIEGLEVVAQDSVKHTIKYLKQISNDRRGCSSTLHERSKIY